MSEEVHLEPEPELKQANETPPSSRVRQYRKESTCSLMNIRAGWALRALAVPRGLWAASLDCHWAVS